MLGLSNTKVCFRLKTEEAREIAGYTPIFRNERWIYVFNQEMWTKFQEHVNLLNIEIKPTNKSLYSQCLALIPDFGTYTSILIFLLGESVSDGYTVDELLSLIVQDENYFYRILDDLNNRIKTDDRYQQICMDVQGYEKQIKYLEAQVADREKRLKSLLKKYKETEDERNKLQDEVDILRLENAPINTKKWVEPKSMPIMKSHVELNEQFSLDTKETVKAVIGNKIHINVNKNLDSDNLDFLKNYYYLVLEFIAVKMPHLITYVRYFTQLQRRKAKQ